MSVLELRATLPYTDRLFPVCSSQWEYWLFNTDIRLILGTAKCQIKCACNINILKLQMLYWCSTTSVYLTLHEPSSCAVWTNQSQIRPHSPIWEEPHINHKHNTIIILHFSVMHYFNKWSNYFTVTIMFHNFLLILVMCSNKKVESSTTKAFNCSKGEEAG